MGLIGMDASQGEAQAERLRAAGDGLGERHDLLDAVVRASGTIWRGPDAERFRAGWSAGASRLMIAQRTALEAAGRRLAEEEQQPGEDAPQSEKDAWNEEYKAYREQPLEDDAFEQGDEFAEEITLEELQQYQSDAGVPVTT